MPEPSLPTDNATDSLAEGLRTRLIDLAALLILVPVLLPLMAVFSPSLYFDTDPRTVGELASAISFGSAGMAYLVVASIAIAAFAMAVCAWQGQRVRWAALVMVALGVVPCLIHMPDHFTSRLHSGAWIAAACLGLAAAHLAQFPRAKRFILTALVAIALPLFIQGAWYVYVEHPETVESFMANERQSIESRGITYGSPQHAKYLTRLQGNDVIGALGMSNVLGSVLAAITFVSAFCFLLSRTRRLRWGYVVATAVVLVMAGWALLLTQSKGAMLALCATAGFAVGVLLILRFLPRARRALPLLCVVLVLAGSIAVLIRGAAGPPDDHTGERSLLFRYHYWQGAAKILIDDPATALLGIGAGKFKDRYEAVRNPISPEVISSTHNVFVDYIVMLGVGGLAWALLLLGWVWCAGTKVECGDSDEAVRKRGPPTIKPLKQFALLAAAVFGIQYYVQFPGLYAATAILWLVGTLGFVFLASHIVYPVWQTTRAWLKPAGLFAACLLLLHAQIEMTFFWPSAAAFMWVVVATASADESRSEIAHATTRAWPRFIPAVGLAVLALVLLVIHAEPMSRHQVHLANATNLLRISGPPAALPELDRAAAVIPNDPATTRWRIRLREEIAVALNMGGQPDVADRLLNEALAVATEAEQAGLDGLSAARRTGILTLGAYYITQNPDWLRQAKDAYTEATRLSPHSLSDHTRLADILWDLGELDAAETNYRRALEISDQYYLDPDVQLPVEERQRIEARLTDSTPG